MQESTIGAWTLGIIMGLLAVLGLIMASGAVDPIFHATGLALSAFGILFIFILIKHNTG
jgi:energy-converting hydrogenase Eha subunit E